MNQQHSAGVPAAGPDIASRSPWLDLRRKRVWAIILVAAYTLAGFFAVPPLLRSQVVDAIREASGRLAQLQEVRFNPFTFELDLAGFRVDDPDGTQLAGFDRLYINFQLSSLFRWAWSFRAIRLDSPYFLLERFAPGDSRLTRLLADLEARGEPETGESESSALPRFLVQDLSIAEGRVQFRDDVPVDPVQLEFGPVTIAVVDLNTLPDREGHQTVNVSLPDGATVSWTGDIALSPLKSSGEFQIVNSHLDRTIAYLKAVLPLQEMQARLSLDTRYQVEEAADGSISFELADLEAELADVSVTGLDPVTEFLVIPRIQLSGGGLRYPEMQVQIASIAVDQPRLEGWLDAEGQPSLLQLLPDTAPDPGADSTAQASQAEARPWQLAVTALSISGGELDFSDRQLDPPAELRLQAMDLNLHDLSNQDQAEIPVEFSASLASGGALGFQGVLTALPEFAARGDANASALALALAQPYVARQFNVLVQEGTLDSKFELQLNPDESVQAVGSLSVNNLKVQDTVEELPLVGWKQLELDRFEFGTAGQQLSLSKLEFDEPYARIVVFANKSTNLANLAVEEVTRPEGDESRSDESGSPELPGILVGGIVLRDGSMDFSDLSLPLPFATHVIKLGGTVSTIDSASEAPADLHLEGQVDEFGLARIDGSMNLLDPLRFTDVGMEFRNLVMSELSPYSIEFAGQKIAEGKLDLDLVYRIDNNQLDGQNAIVMRDLVLGEKVDSPDAASLPLGLAVALLKDSNGVIDIDLPVQGDVSDPEFRMSGVIWKAIVGLVTKIVTAPFRLLGALIGIDSEDLGSFEFLAGRADLTPPEREKVAQLQEALQQRPELAVEISGTHDPEVDRPALQYLRLRDAVLTRIGGAADGNAEELEMLDAQIQATLEALFQERFPEVTLESVQAAHMVPPADDPEGAPVLDDLAYTTDLRDRLLASETVTDADLEALASERASVIRDAFLEGGSVAEERVVLSAPQQSKSEDGDWVPLELGVAVD